MKRGLLSREMVLNKALEVAKIDGLAQLTYNGLARELGVAPQSLYRYVENLADVKKGIIVKYVEQLMVYLTDETAKMTGKAALMRYGTAFMEFSETTISFGDMVAGFATYANDAEVTAALEKLHNLVVELVAKVMTVSANSSEIKSKSTLFSEYIIGHLALTFSNRGAEKVMFLTNLARLADWFEDSGE